LVACQPIRPNCKLSQELECTHPCAHPTSPSLGITSYSTVKEPRRFPRKENIDRERSPEEGNPSLSDPGALSGGSVAANRGRRILARSMFQN